MHLNAIAKIMHNVQQLMEHVCVHLAFREKVVKSLVPMELTAKIANLNVNVKTALNVIRKLVNVFVVRDGKVSSVIVHAIKDVTE